MPSKLKKKKYFLSLLFPSNSWFGTYLIFRSSGSISIWFLIPEKSDSQLWEWVGGQLTFSSGFCALDCIFLPREGSRVCISSGGNDFIQHGTSRKQKLLENKKDTTFPSKTYPQCLGWRLAPNKSSVNIWWVKVWVTESLMKFPAISTYRVY